MEQKCADFYNILMSRYSVRKYRDQPVESEKLFRLLEILRRSQSAANQQPWHFILLKKGGQREEFDETVLTKESFKSSPLIMVACSEPAMAWKRKYDGANYAMVDVTIAITEMITAATAEGLGTCWIAAFDPAKVKEVLKIPAGIEPVGLITVGYPEEPLVKIEKKNRKELDKIIHYGKW